MRFDITALYCCLDDFTQIYDEWARHHLIAVVGQRRQARHLHQTLPTLVVEAKCRQILPTLVVLTHLRLPKRAAEEEGGIALSRRTLTIKTTLTKDLNQPLLFFAAEFFLTWQP